MFRIGDTIRVKDKRYLFFVDPDDHSPGSGEWDIPDIGTIIFVGVYICHVRIEQYSFYIANEHLELVIREKSMWQKDGF